MDEIEQQRSKSNERDKTTNEKPLSLYPLTMDEALREVLQVKPPPKGDKEPTKKTRPKADV